MMPIFAVTILILPFVTLIGIVWVITDWMIEDSRESREFLSSFEKVD